MFLDPAKINLPLEGILAETQEFEKNGNTVRAEVGYRIAGGISIHKGDSEGVKTYFSKAASLTGNARPEYRTIAKRAREAVDIARKYYENI